MAQQEGTLITVILVITEWINTLPNGIDCLCKWENTVVGFLSL